MKNLANCTPREFFAQTVKIKHAVADWLTATDILTIRKRAPIFNINATESEKEAAVKEQAKQNFSAMFDAIMELHPDETLNLIGLMCFVDPDDIDKHPMTEYLMALSEMISNEAVISFFSSLVQLVQMVSSKL